MDYQWTSTIWIWLVTFGFVYLCFLLKRDARIKKYIDEIPGPSAIPFLGNALTFANKANHELLDVLEKWILEYGGFFRVWLVNRAYIVCCTADVVEKVLSSNVHIEKSEDYSVLHPWLGTGLLTAAGKKWFTRRKLLTPTFHFKILEDFVDIFNEQSNILTGLLEERCNGQEFDICPYVTRCALDIICETAMGKKIHAQTQHHAVEYIKAVYGINEILIQRLVRIWLRINWIWKLSPQGRAEKKFLKVLHDFTEKVIEERKVQRNRDKTATDIVSALQEDSAFETKRRRAFLDLLLDVSEEGKVLTDLDIREEVDTFMFEGHDTTAANINFTLFLMACYPTYQKRVQEELDDIFGSDKARNVTSSDLTQMKFLECCIKESLRLYPSVPMITRSLKQDLILENRNCRVPAGVTAIVIPMVLHRDPTVFSNAEDFDPERFLPENCIGRSPFAYVPFSAGPRNCIGQKFALMEEKVILAHVLRAFQLEAVDTRETIQLVPDIILRPANGLRIKISKRE